MKIKIKKNNKNIFIISALCITAALCIATAFYILNNREDYNPSSIPERAESDIQQTKTIENNPTTKTNPGNTDTPTPVVIDKNSGKGVLQMTTSYDIADDKIYIRGGINNSVEYDGICYAELTAPDGKAINKQTTLLQNSATTDCKTISIPLSDLSPGKWSYTLNYTSDNSTGKTDEISFSI